MSLIKNFNQDENQIIHEESREESMLMSKLDISQVTNQKSDCQYFDKNDISCYNNDRSFQIEHDDKIKTKANNIILKESFKHSEGLSEMTNVVVLDQKVFCEIN
jgi:hypothetical protein